MSAIAAIQGAMRRKRRKRVVFGASLAAAAVGMLSFGASRLFVPQTPPAVPTASVVPRAAEVTVVGHPVGGGATVVETGNRAPLADGKSLVSGSRVMARTDGNVVLSVSTGTRLTVEGGGDVAIVESGADQVFALDAGAVRADVAKLFPGRRFILRTPDSEVEVRGTSFRVAMVESDPTCGDGTVTRVAVYEGVVSVRHAGLEARVSAGEVWPAGCATSPKSSTRPAPVSAVTAPGSVRPHGKSLPLAPRSGAAVEPSDLKEQNDCMARAFEAKRRGAASDAIELFESCAARFPASALVENALAQRMRLLRSVDAARAATAARQYLVRYPKGFARTEAESLSR